MSWSTSSVLKLIVIILLSMLPDSMDGWSAIGELSLYPQWIPIISASEGHTQENNYCKNFSLISFFFF